MQRSSSANRNSALHKEDFCETVDLGLEIDAHVSAHEQSMAARFGVDVAQRMALFEI